MLQASVNVRFLNPPKGKGPASIKDADGNYYKFWTTGKKAIPLDSFKEGMTYSVGYESEDYQGKEQRTIIAVSKAQEQAPQVGNGKVAEMGRTTPPTDAERIFVCGILNAGIHSGTIQVTATDIASAVNCARDAWRATFGKDL